MRVAPSVTAQDTKRLHSSLHITDNWTLAKAFLPIFCAGGQLQQPGIQPEEVNSVSDETASHFSFGLPVYSKFKILFYTFTKTLGQRFDIFRSPSGRLIISINHCCSSEFLLQWFSWNQPYHLLSTSSMCPIVNLWLHCNSCNILQFISYLSKSCLPLTSCAHYLLKRLLALSLKFLTSISYSKMC